MRNIQIFGNKTPNSFNIFEFNGIKSLPISNFPGVVQASTPSASRATASFYTKSSNPKFNSINEFQPGKGYVVLASENLTIQTDLQPSASVIRYKLDLFGPSAANQQDGYNYIEYPFSQPVNIASYPQIAAVYRISPNSSTRSIWQTFLRSQNTAGVPQVFTTLEPGKQYIIRATANVSINNPSPTVTPTLTPIPTSRPTPPPTPTLPPTIASVTKLNTFDGIGDTEQVLNFEAGKGLDGDNSRVARIGSYKPFWGTTFGFVRIVMTDGNDYTFAYTYGGKDFVARRDNRAKTWTLVGYMYDGGKSGENLAFANSDSTTMRWGNSSSNSCNWNFLLYPDSTYTNNTNIVKFTTGLPNPPTITTFSGVSIPTFSGNDVIPF